MTTEAVHNVLKGIYFQRNQNRRIDHLLCKLLKTAQDKVFDGLIKNEKGKKTYKMRAMGLHHERGEEIQEDYIIEPDNANWRIRSQEDEHEMYMVKAMNELCNCLIRCSSCTDFNVRGIACKHNHAVHMKMSHGSVDANLNTVNSDSIVEHQEADGKEYFQQILTLNSKQTERMVDLDKPGLRS
eukprot:gene2189-2491_t